MTKQTKLTENTPQEEVMHWVKMLFIAFFVAKLLTIFIQPTLVSGESMNHTLQNADYLIMNKMAYSGDSTPEYGDIVVFNGGKDHLIKRIIGKPGDNIVIESGEVYRNGEKLKEPYIDEATPGELDVIVTDGAYFVLGDNRDNSMDSRTIGAIPEEYITGQAVLRVFPIPALLK